MQTTVLAFVLVLRSCDSSCMQGCNVPAAVPVGTVGMEGRAAPRHASVLPSVVG